MVWHYRNPVEILFGAGSFKEVARCIAGRRYAAVTYPDAHFGELLDRLEAQAGAACLTITDVLANPDYQELGPQVEKIADAGPIDVWIALGGGSVIDSTKVFAAANGDFANVKRYLETGDGAAQLSSTPIIAVPTTSGTGSEVTCWATVWDRATGSKYSLARPGLYPEYSIIDPELMLAKPLDLTVSTGLDALSHALESLWNVNANPVSANHAVAAAREVLDVLVDLADDLGNLDHRTRMARAAMFAGLAFSNTKTAIAHSLSYPITLRHGIPHGIACSFTLPLVIDSVVGKGGLCDASLDRIFDGNLGSAAGKVAMLLERLNVSTNPAAYGVHGDEWDEIVSAAFDGERGKNFIGDKERFMTAAEALRAAAAE